MNFLRRSGGAEPVPSQFASSTAETESRKAPRERALCRIACVRTANDEGLARLKNLSDEGMMIRLSLSVERGDDVHIRLSETVNLNGRVVWADGPDCGVKLSQAIDSVALLKHLAAQEKFREIRPLRLSVSTEAVVSGQMGIRKVAVDDVSQRGMKIQHDGIFAEGMIVNVNLRSGLHRSGVVRWSREGLAGIMFLEPVGADILGSMRRLQSV